MVVDLSGFQRRDGCLGQGPIIYLLATCGHRRITLEPLSTWAVLNLAEGGGRRRRNERVMVRRLFGPVDAIDWREMGAKSRDRV